MRKVSTEKYTLDLAKLNGVNINAVSLDKLGASRTLPNVVNVRRSGDNAELPFNFSLNKKRIFDADTSFNDNTSLSSFLGVENGFISFLRIINEAGSFSQNIANEQPRIVSGGWQNPQGVGVIGGLRIDSSILSGANYKGVTIVVTTTNLNTTQWLFIEFNGTNKASFGFYINTNGSITWTNRLSTSDTATTLTTAPNVVTANNTHIINLEFNNVTGNYFLKVNGFTVQSGTSTITGTPTGVGRIFLGRLSGLGINTFQGIYHEVYYYTEPLPNNNLEILLKEKYGIS